MTYRTPLLDLQWVVVSGQGKVKFQKEDNKDPKNYEYQATVVFPDEASMKIEKEKFDTFWRENKPKGFTKQKYDMFKPEMVPDLDANGKEQKDADGAIIRKATGRWTLTAKTNIVWPEGKPNEIKLLRASGQPLYLGDKQIGNGSVGVLHGSVSINEFAGNEGLLFHLSGVQLKKFVPYEGSEIQADNLGEDEGMEDADMDAMESQAGPAI